VEATPVTTAREKLFQEIIALLPTPAGDGALAEMRKIMARYRVQTKPGIEIGADVTARDALGDRLLELWRKKPAGVEATIGTTIDEFRMQLKQDGPAKPSKPRTANTRAPAVVDDDPPPSRTPSKPAAAKSGARAPMPSPERPVAKSAPAAAPRASSSSSLGIGLSDPPAAHMRGRPASAEPVAGGPRKRGKSRGECPKCKSLGVVLARSYAGDDYFSCIYCGWQAYKPTDEDDPNASLAVRLLGQTLID
jgi:hypothetical protein